LALTALLLCVLLVSGCAAQDRNPIPPAGTGVDTRAGATSEVFSLAARDLGQHCEQIGGCTCVLDGIRTTCSLVFACLDAGFCERVAQ
jgi:hypothetical protein